MDDRCSCYCKLITQLRLHSNIYNCESQYSPIYLSQWEQPCGKATEQTLPCAVPGDAVLALAGWDMCQAQPHPCWRARAGATTQPCAVTPGCQYRTWWHGQEDQKLWPSGTKSVTTATVAAGGAMSLVTVWVLGSAPPW